MEMLFGSARDLRGEAYFNKMVNEAINRTKKVKDKIGLENAIQLRKVNSVMERVIEIEGMDSYEGEQLGLMYNNLAPNDTSHQISAKMMKEFLEGTVKIQNPEAYEKICRYYDFKNPLPDKQMKKLGRFVENIWNKYRTVEYCYLYSKSFNDFVEQYAVKVDADGIDDLEKIKWLRLWLFIIKDQGFFWTDIKPNGTIMLAEQLEFDREAYLFPDCMLYHEEYIRKYLPDKALNVEMLRRFINLYPDDIQKQIYTWAEMNGNTNNMLRAGEVRMGIKKKLFPITWMTPMNLFCLNNNIKDNNPKYLEAAVIAYKNGGVENLDRIEQKGTDPFERFKVKRFKGYEVYSSENNNDEIEKVLVVNSQRELEMFVEVYKWLLEHPDFRFGEENKTVAEYGIGNLFEETEDEVSDDWFFEMDLVASDEDINWECFEKVIEGNEEVMSEYLKAKTTADDVFDEIGFSSVNQAKLVCNKRTKLLESEAVKMSAALKRIKMFGEAQAMKADIIYLKLFKYMISERPKDLPKTMVKLYGNLK